MTIQTEPDYGEPQFNYSSERIGDWLVNIQTSTYEDWRWAAHKNDRDVYWKLEGQGEGLASYPWSGDAVRDVAAAAPRRFYVDFRTRLLLLVFPEEDVVAAKIAVREEPVSGRKASLANDGEPRYFYIDGEGEIRFAVTLRDIPSAFRSEAKSLAR